MPRKKRMDHKDVTHEPTVEEINEPTADVCKSSPSPEAVDIPYPDTGTPSDALASGKLESEGKQIATKITSVDRSSGDEPGESGLNGLDRITKTMKETKIFNVPLWIWGVASIILVLAFWILLSSRPQLTEPVEILQLY